MSEDSVLLHQTGVKDPNCPACGGRSFDASGGSDDYHECNLCETPTEAGHEWYRSRWPAIYAKWMEGRC